jgi:TrmH family RNA methyltransferase
MITGSNSEKLKWIRRLNAKAKARREEAAFVLEGRKLFQETPAALRRAVFISESFAGQNPEFESAVRNAPYEVEIVADRLFASVCDTKTPQGILTIASFPEWKKEDLIPSEEPPLLMVLEAVQDPGNVGTILRTAEGAGVTGVVLLEGCADVFSPKVIRATMGSIFRVPFLAGIGREELTAFLAKEHIRSFAAHLNGREYYTEETYREGSAFFIGNEGNGLSNELTAAADALIRIPMAGEVESLNASIAAALLMYEANRQRRY